MPKANGSLKLVPFTRLVLCLAILGLTLVLTSAAAQASAFPPAQPLREMLNSDGTLNLTSGFRGSLDARGWRLVSGPNEPPRFAPQAAPLAVPGNQDWASNFTFRGVSATVNGIAVDSSDNVYAGGMFTVAGGVAANYVAKWSASGWSALSSGTNSMVTAVATDPSGNVYAGGGFSTAVDRWSPGSLPAKFAQPKDPNVSANFVAKWNGATWSSMGSGMEGLVVALAADGSGNVYAGGHFTTAGGATVNGIAKWNGSAWSAMGHGFDAPVYALAVDGSDNLYAGGAFTLACDATCNPATSTPANYIAKWNGSAWSAVGNGFNAAVLALAVDNSDNVYAGGTFTLACDATCNPATSTPANHIANWNGSAWSAMGHGFDSVVFALAVDGGDNVYAGGFFTRACDATCAPATSTPVNYIAQWNGGAWSALSGGTSAPVTALGHDSSNNVYAGGMFSAADSTAVSYIAKWNGSAWSALGNGDAANGTVIALARDNNNNVYAGGGFTTAASLPAKYVAKWNGSAWSAVGNGFNATVIALAVDGSDNVYAGGVFTLACDATCNYATSTIVNYIAKWNGSTWSAMGNGFDAPVLALAVDSSDNVYAGGIFTLACDATCNPATSTTVNRIAMWNGSAWSAMGNGFDAPVSALAVDGSNNVYAGGSFTLACDATCNPATSTTVNRIAMWNGANWLPLAKGLSGTVAALAVDASNNVYAGGSFTNAIGGLPLRRVGRWDGATWWALGDGVNNSVSALALDGANLYAGGNFTQVCDATCNSATSATANRIAVWSGAAWSPLGSGTNGGVQALATRSKTLFVGGSFTMAGGKVSGNVGSVVTGQLYFPLAGR